jgi:hypothetical protein
MSRVGIYLEQHLSTLKCAYIALGCNNFIFAIPLYVLFLNTRSVDYTLRGY